MWAPPLRPGRTGPLRGEGGAERSISAAVFLSRRLSVSAAGADGGWKDLRRAGRSEKERDGVGRKENPQISSTLSKWRVFARTFGRVARGIFWRSCSSDFFMCVCVRRADCEASKRLLYAPLILSIPQSLRFVVG